MPTSVVNQAPSDPPSRLATLLLTIVERSLTKRPYTADELSSVRAELQALDGNRPNGVRKLMAEAVREALKFTVLIEKPGNWGRPIGSWRDNRDRFAHSYLLCLSKDLSEAARRMRARAVLAAPNRSSRQQPAAVSIVPVKVTDAERSMLIALAEASEPPTGRELASRCGYALGYVRNRIRKGAMAKLVSKHGQSGYCLTEAGRQYVSTLRPSDVTSHHK